MKTILVSCIKPELPGVRKSTWLTLSDGNFHITDLNEQRSILQKIGKYGVDYKIMSITPSQAKFFIKQLLPD